jgi:hypothetical protein
MRLNMIEQDFKYFLECLIKATRKMDSHYFQLPVAQGDEPIYRERVYCYELYHQLRCILENNFPYKLHGEVDKGGHPVIRGFKKPDFALLQTSFLRREKQIGKIYFPPFPLQSSGCYKL